MLLVDGWKCITSAPLDVVPVHPVASARNVRTNDTPVPAWGILMSPH